MPLRRKLDGVVPTRDVTNGGSGWEPWECYRCHADPALACPTVWSRDTGSDADWPGPAGNAIALRQMAAAHRAPQCTQASQPRCTRIDQLLLHVLLLVLLHPNPMPVAAPPAASTTTSAADSTPTSSALRPARDGGELELDLPACPALPPPPHAFVACPATAPRRPSASVCGAHCCQPAPCTPRSGLVLGLRLCGHDDDGHGQHRTVRHSATTPDQPRAPPAPACDPSESPTSADQTVRGPVL